jgi:ABC-type dipeptide/oligopeptide/nickel transport system permease component
MIPTLLGVAVITFVVMKATPGGPFDDAALGKRVSPEVVARLNAKYGFNDPLPVQFVRYVGHAIRGDFGVSVSLQQGTSVATIIKQGLGKTVTLGLFSLVVILVLAIPLGMIAALRQNRLADYVSLFFATAGASVPNFVLAIILVILFSVRLHWIPTQGWGRRNKRSCPSSRSHSRRWPFSHGSLALRCSTLLTRNTCRPRGRRTPRAGSYFPPHLAERAHSRRDDRRPAYRRVAGWLVHHRKCL